MPDFSFLACAVYFYKMFKAPRISSWIRIKSLKYPLNRSVSFVTSIISPCMEDHTFEALSLSWDHPLLPVVVIGGATASGKTSLALDIAAHRNACIINGDAFQLYRDIPYISAQPDIKVQQEYPHFLYGVLSPNEQASVGWWLLRATKAIFDSQRAGKIPILVGGSGMYLKRLIEGIAPIPSINTLWMQNLVQEYEHKSLISLWQRVVDVDPDMASWLKPTDTQRVLRAYAVLEQTGKPISYYQKLPPMRYLSDKQSILCWTVIIPDRPILYSRINQRLALMLSSGHAQEEIETLINKGVTLDDPIAQAIGVREFFEASQNKVSWSTALQQAQLRTRHYAKRQCTWFRHQWNGQEVDYVGQGALSTKVILDALGRNLDNQ
jgi:tRNA dimethylallyltransferase